MLGSLASVPLPPTNGAGTVPGPELDPLQETLRSRYRIEVPVLRWSEAGRRVLRISAQLYNTTDQYVRLADALRAEI
jgi:isopenicillin-N epimerase